MRSSPTADFLGHVWPRSVSRLRRERGRVSQSPIIARVRAVMCEAYPGRAERKICRLLKLSRWQSSRWEGSLRVSAKKQKDTMFRRSSILNDNDSRHAFRRIVRRYLDRALAWARLGHDHHTFGDPRTRRLDPLINTSRSDRG
jgi:hypothetical protein